MSSAKGGGYTQLPDLLFELLKPPQLYVYRALLKRDRGNGCWSTKEKIGGEAGGLSAERVRSILRDLRKLGVITVQHRQKDSGVSDLNLYRCLVFVRKREIVDLREKVGGRGLKTTTYPGMNGGGGRKRPGEGVRSDRGEGVKNDHQKTDPTPKTDPTKTDPTEHTQGGAGANTAPPGVCPGSLGDEVRGGPGEAAAPELGAELLQHPLVLAGCVKAKLVQDLARSDGAAVVGDALSFVEAHGAARSPSGLLRHAVRERLGPSDVAAGGPVPVGPEPRVTAEPNTEEYYAQLRARAAWRRGERLPSQPSPPAEPAPLSTSDDLDLFDLRGTS